AYSCLVFDKLRREMTLKPTVKPIESTIHRTSKVIPHAPFSAAIVLDRSMHAYPLEGNWLDRQQSQYCTSLADHRRGAITRDPPAKSSQSRALFHESSSRDPSSTWSHRE